MVESNTLNPLAGLYVHIPFCASRCIYCGFYSTTGLNLQSAYIDALLEELRLRTDNKSAFCNPKWETIYFGGGTPSTIDTHLLNKLIDGIFELSDSESPIEFTMECNPDDITPEFATWIESSRINRVSMGVQSFNDERLRWIHRRHTSQQVKNAVELLRNHGISNISIDLMFGFPGQTLSEWVDDITEALTLNPDHISAYSLMYEEGTPLYHMLEKGEIEEIDEELSLQMFNTLIDRLTAAGFEHYEISNFARPGYRSRHNSSYWCQKPYLGIGAAAHSFDKNKRWWNIADVKQYISNINKGFLPSESEIIDETTRYNDIITTALRTREGICLEDVTSEQKEYLLQQAEKHIKAQKLVIQGNHLHLTRSGIYTSDDIMSDLIWA